MYELYSYQAPTLSPDQLKVRFRCVAIHYYSYSLLYTINLILEEYICFCYSKP